MLRQLPVLPRLARFNPDSAFATNCLTAVLFGGDGVILPHCAVTGLPLSNAVSVVGLAGEPALNGPVISAATTNASARYTIPGNHKVNPPYTLVAGIRRVGTGGANVTYVGGSYDAANGSPFITHAFIADSAGTSIKGSFNASGTLQTGPSVSIPANEYHIWACVWDTGSSQRLYKDGVQVATTATAHTATNYSATSNFGVGDAASNSRNPNIYVSHAYGFARALSVNEIWELATPASRFALFWTPSTRTYFVVNAAAPPTVTYPQLERVMRGVERGVAA